ncbi:MAG: phosphopentomutase [Oceanotoga sp.]|jgi:phosphopentomutase|uniref:phosphopentomutase n=1 Tax=Oceanotoga sp. TaxID=2108366 RepID=UPI002656ABCD|nr:phosphopentomutase [Oceanotoga sp.]MDN5342649.1 phosphopentomutase [Oceanotoga sp.]
MGKFTVIVLDSYGVGYMDDVIKTRPEDFGANTAKHIFEKTPGLKLPTLEKLGLMNALNMETENMKKNPDAVFGKSSLMHFNADTFYGHQEIMGTNPKHPIMEPFSKKIDIVYNELIKKGYNVEYIGEKLKILLVNNCVTVGDNLEADGGQAYNVTSTFDKISFEEVIEIGKIVRSQVQVSRVIAFGGKDVTKDDLINSIETKDDTYIGVNAPKSGVYNKDYLVIHLGYGIDPEVQIPTILGKNNIPVTLIGKVADIVENRYGKSIPGVDTEYVMKQTIEEFKKMKDGFICTNVQETDLAGHAENVERYVEKLKVSDKYIKQLIDIMEDDDYLIVMADHGNDPTIGHSHHTRENVPLLIYNKNKKNINIGHRKTMSDVGATVAEYFKIEAPENGTSFLNQII